MNKKVTLLVVSTIAVLMLRFGHDFPIHWFVAPLGFALVIGLPLAMIYGLVRFVKACWNRP